LSHQRPRFHGTGLVWHSRCLHAPPVTTPLQAPSVICIINTGWKRTPRDNIFVDHRSGSLPPIEGAIVMPILAGEQGDLIFVSQCLNRRSLPRPVKDAGNPRVCCDTFTTPWRKIRELPVCSGRVPRSIAILATRLISMLTSRHILRGTARHAPWFWLITQRSLVQIQPPLPYNQGVTAQAVTPFSLVVAWGLRVVASSKYSSSRLSGQYQAAIAGASAMTLATDFVDQLNGGAC
jgi:hypothetical protein